ncbi:MAG: transglycosylase domain-containing protein, partial [Bacteroidetes bacterium]|nr:transglycosylase domain-containing protein [Bacteroidota bacterium]
MKNSIRIFWRIFGICVALFIIFLFAVNYGLMGEMPSLAELENPSMLQATEIYANDGTLMGKYYLDRGNRSNVKYRDISKHIIDALVATEDHNFYDHSGIDAKGTLAIPYYLIRGQRRGSSTITQQLALNLFGERAHNSFKRGLQKIKEWIIAIKLERNFTKEEILALYLNTVPYSDNVYGIRNASLTFFQKEPDRVSVEEAAVLVGMLNGNYRYNPRVNPKLAMDRRNLVLQRMVENNSLGAGEADKLKLKPIQLNYRKQDENT